MVIIINNDLNAFHKTDYFYVLSTVGINESEVIVETNGNNSSLTFKNLLLERWILLLNLFGLHAENKIVRADSTAETLESSQTVLGPVAVDEGARKTANTNANAYAAAVGMVDTAYKERGPLTADEGASLRMFFQAEGHSHGERPTRQRDTVEDKGR